MTVALFSGHVIGALRAVKTKMGEWLQQIPGTISEISVQKNTIAGIAKILHITQLEASHIF